MRAPRRVRSRLALSGLALVVVLPVAACQTAGERLAEDARASSVSPSAPAKSVAEVEVVPGTGAVDVAPDTPVTVTAINGQLSRVTVSGPAGPVEGTLGPDRTTWTSTGALALASSYTVDAVAVDPNGLETAARTTFSTLAPTHEQTLDISMSPIEDEVVGVGMPVVLYLSDPVEEPYRAAVEAEVGVTSVPEIEGAWHWISATELHWRPRDLWPAGAQVTVDVSAEGVRAGEALWGGAQDGSLREVGHFTITPHAITSQVDLAQKQMTVFQDGTPIRTIPITGGKPGWETRNGTKVILEKHRNKTMDAATLGIDPGDPEYYALDVEYALRVTWSGEFIHSAPWSVGQQGADLVSHGCVGMSEADAMWLFDLTTKGDIVTVTGSPKPLEKGNGYTDWNYTWDEWVAGSALSGGTTPQTTGPG